jgi:Xaa-Pro aminopeptidase
MTAPITSLLPMETARRVERLRERFDQATCDALLVTRLVNIRYLTGFTGSAALLLVRADGLVFVTDGRYGEQSAEELRAAGVEASIEVSATVAGQRAALQAAARGVTRLGLEAASVTWAEQQRFASEWFTAAELVPTTGLVEDLRLVKDAGELARMEAAAAAADRALAVVRPMLAQRPEEREVALALEIEMRREGASGPSFETIVASGANGAKPHARPSARRIEPGELVVIDFGAVVEGYCSDMTRTLCVGEPGSPTARRMVEVVTASQQAGVDAVAPGVTGQAVDEVCRAVIADAGWADAFIHGTGHGVGLEIHEAPRVSSASTDTLASGHVVTVEPGVYLPGVGGVRIEDTVIVTEAGCTPLTHAPKTVVVGSQR